MRKAVDPFGISILDLLSNALGATILLMLIVSVKSRGMGDIPNDAPPQVGTGTFLTIPVGKQKETKDTSYVIQVKLYGKKHPITVSGVAEYEIFNADSLDSNDYWLVKINGSEKKAIISADNGDSVQSTVFRGGAPVWHDTRKIKTKRILDLSDLQIQVK